MDIQSEEQWWEPCRSKSWKLQVGGGAFSVGRLTQGHVCCRNASGYLMVMVSPGRALMFQLQFSRDGYWKGHPGLVMTPLDARRSSATSLQAGPRGMGGQTDRRLASALCAGAAL